MTSSNGTAEKSLGEVVNEVSTKASLLIREEIELAKTEVATKVKSLGKGAAVAAAAGVFGFFALIYFLEALAWFFNDLFDWVNTSPWLGFLIVVGILLVFAGIAAMLGLRWIKKGSPPTPELAIEEAKRTRAEILESH